jgi:hypothetical protein
VKHNIVTPEYIRLAIDGVDVTAYATKGPNELDYRPAGPRAGRARLREAQCPGGSHATGWRGWTRWRYGRGVLQLVLHHQLIELGRAVNPPTG